MSRVPIDQRNNAAASLSNGLRRMAPGSATGGFAQASPARPLVKARRVEGGGGGLWVGDEAPTDGSVFWYDPDEIC